jgi:hypothetical protein
MWRGQWRKEVAGLINSALHIFCCEGVPKLRRGKRDQAIIIFTDSAVPLVPFEFLLLVADRASQS